MDGLPGSVEGVSEPDRAVLPPVFTVRRRLSSLNCVLQKEGKPLMGDRPEAVEYILIASLSGCTSGPGSTSIDRSSRRSVAAHIIAVGDSITVIV